jgi:flagellar secretion chaperone FliS
MTSPRIAYREAEVRGATPVRLVVLLYNQLIQDLTRAAQAIELNNIEMRTNCINHAILVVGYLQSPLDFERGGKVARDLDHFYNTLRQNLVQAQFLASQAGIHQQITDVLALREAWLEVERTEKAAVRSEGSPSTKEAAAPASIVAEPERVRVDWQG